MHHNEDIFPDSHEFNPERWPGDLAATNPRYVITFSRGTRQFLSMNLAWAGMYLLLSTLFRTFETEMWETDKQCVELRADFSLPKIKKEGESRC